MINEWIKSPVTLLLLAGIIAILAAIIKGEINVGPIKIPKLNRIQSWLAGIVGIVLFSTGLIVIAKAPPTSSTGAVVYIENPGNTSVDTTTKVQVKKNIDIHGKLIDVFENAIPSERIRLFNDSIDRFSNTNDDGLFCFADMHDKISCTFEYMNTTKKTFIDTEISNQCCLQYNPIIKADIILCNSIDRAKKMALGVFEGDNLVIPVDSLLVDDDSGLRVISCYMELYGSFDYAKENDIVLSFIWKTDEHEHALDMDVAFSESGWRTWITKKVWKGKWKLEIKTKTGFVFEKFIFEIV